ncbi:MAG: hypothetical protein QOH28_3100 [Actinomycetota bacterium]|jgi:hypothetical protein|nr:hypothetical protein [Actinomycetota bacterium]
MPSRRQLDHAQQTGFDHLDRFDSDGDPAALRAAADVWRWVAQSTSDPGQRSFVVAAVSVALRRYFDTTKELWALRDAIDAARFAVTTEQSHARWLMACIYLGAADYTYFDTTGERAYLDDAIAVLRSAAVHSAGAESRGPILSHLVAALQKAYRSGKEKELLVEAVEVGREAARLPSPLQVDSVVDLMANLGDLSYVRDDLDLLREAEAVGRSALAATDPASRGRVLFALARTLESIGVKTNDPAVVADAVATGEASIQLCADAVDRHLRGVVIDGIRQQLQRMQPPPAYPLPPL